MKVLTALFGPENTVTLNCIKPPTQSFAVDALGKKLVVAKEVHISSHSREGNALKDLITNTAVSVEPKYQPVVNIPQRSCFLFTADHKPLWLEGGEWRYYIIDMDHGGHAQGPDNDKFVELVRRVKAMTEDQQPLQDFYARLMVRAQSENFDPKDIGGKMNATPIMRELQATAGKEGDKVLRASEDLPKLASTSTRFATPSHASAGRPVVYSLRDAFAGWNSLRVTTSSHWNRPYRTAYRRLRRARQRDDFWGHLPGNI